MRMIMMLIAVSLLAGCAPSMPMHSLGLYTTSTGQQKWRFVYRNLSEETIQAFLESEINKAKICQNGWEELSREPVRGDMLIDGRCK